MPLDEVDCNDDDDEEEEDEEEEESMLAFTSPSIGRMSH